MGGTGALFRPITAHLEQKYDCIAPDQRGHGASNLFSENNFSSKDYALDIISLLKRLDLISSDQKTEQKVGLIGHSMGVRTALHTAALVPENILGIICVDLALGSPFGGGLGPAFKSFISNLPANFPDRSELKAYLQQFCPDPSIAAYLTATAKQNANGDIGFPFSNEALRMTVDQADEHPPLELVKSLEPYKIPILFLRGAKSLVWKSEDYESQKTIWSHSKQFSFEEWENSSHGLPFEERSRFVEKVDLFFSPLSASK